MLKIIVSFSTLALAGIVYGQVLNQPSGSGGSTPPPSTPPGQPAPATTSSGGSDQPLLGGELPFFDPGSGVASWDGKLWNVTNNRLFAARFEKYLAAPEAITAEDEAYRKLFEEIEYELSPSRPGGPNFPAGVALLPEAAQFPIDAKLCDSLANAIWGVWLSQRNAANLNAANEAMRQRLKVLRWNRRIETETDLTKQDVRNNRPNGGNDQPSGSENSSAEGDAAEFERITGYIADATELQAKMTANKGEILISKAQAKIEFQALLVQLFLQRRFQHVVIGCRFYRNQFMDGDSKLHYKEDSDFGDTFATGTGFEPTIGTLETFAQEAIRDVDEGVRAFEVLLERGDMESASERLGEAFIVGEYMPKIRRVPLEKKLDILEFVRYNNRLLASIESKNYGAAEEVLLKIKEVARDFDDSKPQALIQSQKMLATAFLNEARNAAVVGERETMTEAMGKSLEIWPNNPAVAEFLEQMSRVGLMKAQATDDFRRAIEEGDTEKILANQDRFLLGIQGDDLKGQFMEIEARAKDIIRAIEKSRAVENENPSAAWEIIKRAKEEFGSDPKLNDRLLETIDRASKFREAIVKAHEFERNYEYGSSLSYYFKAEEINPRSLYAKEGIKRILDAIETGVDSEGPSSGGSSATVYSPPPAAPSTPSAPSAPGAPSSTFTGSGPFE